MDWLKKAPTPVIVAVIIVSGLSLLALLGGFVALTWADKPTEDYRSFVSTLAQLITLPLVGLGTVAATSAARSASRTEDQTNGQLAKRDDRIEELQRQVRLLRGTNDHG